MTTSRRTIALAVASIATAGVLGMTASSWNPYTRAIDSLSMPAPIPEPTTIAQLDPAMQEAPIRLGGYWDRVEQELGDSLAEGAAPDADTRDWESCRVHFDYAWTWVQCPDHYQEAWWNW